MSASAVESVLIHSYITMNKESRRILLAKVRKLCDRLEENEDNSLEDLRENILKES